MKKYQNHFIRIVSRRSKIRENAPSGGVNGALLGIWGSRRSQRPRPIVVWRFALRWQSHSAAFRLTVANGAGNETTKNSKDTKEDDLDSRCRRLLTCCRAANRPGELGSFFSALCATVRRSVLAVLGIGLALGICVNLKIHGPVYVLPMLLLLFWRTGTRGLVACFAEAWK